MVVNVTEVIDASGHQQQIYFHPAMSAASVIGGMGTSSAEHQQTYTVIQTQGRNLEHPTNQIPSNVVVPVSNVGGQTVQHIAGFEMMY